MINLTTLISLSLLFAHCDLVKCLVNFKYDPIIITKSESDAIRSITPNEWLEFTRRGIESDNQEKRLESQLVNADVYVHNDTISHVQLLATLPNAESRRDSDVADKILKSTLNIFNTKCAPQGVSGDHCEAILSDQELPHYSVLRVECQSVIDSRHNGHYPFRRLLSRFYKDGFYQMFTDTLPASLSISNELCINSAKKEFMDEYQGNIAVVQWAQFIAYDLSKTVVTSMADGSAIECCNAEHYKLKPRHNHPACEPLISTDPATRYGRNTCLNYVRSALAVGKCTFAAPEQLNQATAKLDLSPLYGFTETSRQRMRSFKNGHLKSTEAATLAEALLPLVTKDAHTFCVNNLKCFMAGDSRVNSNPFAILIYTIFMRNHNRIASELKQKYTHWDDEQLFQKAKTINTRSYLKVVFDEWLPMVLGKSMADEINTQRSAARAEDEVHDQQVSNEYAVAAGRFYLSMMPNILHSFAVDTNFLPGLRDYNEIGSNEDIFTLKDQLYNKNISYTSKILDDILNALLKQRPMKMDASYAESLISDFMGSKRPTHRDLLAFDIQRGRDHGLQPYYKYLEICNNVKVNNWSDFNKFISLEDVDKLKKIYTNWSEIDLIVGGISEIPAKGATVGNTFQCIIAEQFSKLHEWQRQEINEFDATFSDLTEFTFKNAAHLLCLNSNLRYVPSNVFQIASDKNPVLACADLRTK